MRIGRLRFVLTRPRKRSFFEVFQYLDERLSAKQSQLFGELRCGPVTAWHYARSAISPGVQTLFHLHDAHTDLFIACQNSAFDRRRPTPTRQERPVHIQTPETRQIEHRCGEQHTIGGNADDIGDQAFKLIEGIVVFERGVFEHGNLVRERCLLHGAGLELLATGTDRIGLREHAHHSIALRQLIEDGRSKCRSSHENDSHTCAFLPLAIQLRRASRHVRAHLGILAALEPYRSDCMLRRASCHPGGRSHAAGNDRAGHHPR